MGVPGVLPKPSASTGVTKAQGKSSGCQQGIRVGPVGAWDRRSLQSSPWQLGVLSVLLEATLQRCAIQHLEKHLLSHSVSARRHQQWLSRTLMCQDTIHSPVRPQRHTEKDTEGSPRRARLWTALTAGPEEAAGQEFLSWASAEAQRVDPGLAQM